MQSAVSTLFYRQEFDGFLHAPIGGQPSEMPLSVLSGFTRLHIDPWLETAALTGLSRADAKSRLATLIARLPRHRWVEPNCETIAERLVDLLPNPTSSNSAVAQRASSYFRLTPTAMHVALIALAIIALLLWRAS